jgi:hypothetical protein
MLIRHRPVADQLWMKIRGQARFEPVGRSIFFPHTRGGASGAVCVGRIK